jgi:hypothetical protein
MKRFSRQKKLQGGSSSPEMSHERVEVVGNDAASSAQSKRMGAGVEHGSTGLDGGLVRGRGCRTGLGV